MREGATLVGLVAAAASTRPDSEALVGATTRFTWVEYRDAIDRVAATLLGAGLRPGDRVAVAFPKDAASFLAIHGTLRAGGVVVPVDPLAPPLSTAGILTDAGVSAVFAAPRAIAALDLWSGSHPGLRLVVSSGDAADRALAWGEVMSADPAVEFPVISEDDPAYVIYTSGSTGRPKGIVHSHRSALAYAELAVATHGIRADDRIAGMSPLHFDMSTLELYAAPAAGAAVVVFGEGHLRFPASFTGRSAQESVTVWYTVPSFLRQVVERGALDQRDRSRLRLVMYGGESYSPGALRELFEAVPGAEVKNIYGPAEVNECTNHRVTLDQLDRDVPIGRPWAGVELNVVDDEGCEVPVGEPGELWVSAPTLMMGYWQRPDLTDRSVHARADGPDWYATGDLVFVDADGVYWFLGRRDHQVKVRGIRIELEAVEAALTDAPGVLHAVAAPVGPAGEIVRVDAVVVARDGAELDLEAVRAHCRARLPAVAVPHDIIERSQLPRTQSGKLDRRRVREEHASTGSAVGTEASGGTVGDGHG